MKMKKVLMSCLMLAAAMTASAQEEQKGTTEYVFQPHWYIQLQGGAQYTTGECDFSDLISPNVQFAVGYNFSKGVGARLALNAWQGKAGYQESVTKWAGDCNYKYTYFAPGLDFTFNLSNIIAGINPNRVVSFGAFFGGGLNIRSACDDAATIKTKLESAATKYLGEGKSFTPMYENKSAVLPYGRIGLTLDFKLSDAVSLGLEAQGNITGDKFNFKDAGNPDSYFNLLAGLKINLGKGDGVFGRTYSTKFIPAPKPEVVYVDKIVEKIVEVEKPAPVVEPLRRDIFFVINKYEIRESEKGKVAEIAAYLKKYPKAKVALCGYADAQTGNDRINDRLGLQRVTVVKNMLINEYNIPESRITADSKGAREQPFAINEQNRVTIAIAE